MVTITVSKNVCGPPPPVVALSRKVGSEEICFENGIMGAHLNIGVIFFPISQLLVIFSKPL